MDLDKLHEFIRFMDENQLCELEIEEEGQRIKLKKAIPNQQPPAFIAANSQIATPAATQHTENSNIEITSPMVGTFYRAPSPGAKPYVEIGEIVKPGDVVCIIEAMKLMNEIKAEVGGKIVRILAENGEPIEFGQQLFEIEPA